jgi:hypothetical protein
MTITRTFICQEHEDYGMNGLVLKDHPTFEPLQGMTVAHDILEHYPKDSGELHEEFMAIGAMLYGRGEGGYFAGRSSSVEDNCVADLTNIIHYASSHNKELKPCTFKVVAPDTSCFDCDTYEELGVQHIQNEFSDRLEYYDIISTNEKIEEFVNQACRWICRGYYKAKDRYRNTDSYTLTELFRNCEQQIDNELKSLIVGQEVKVTINLVNATVRVIVLDNEEYEY